MDAASLEILAKCGLRDRFPEECKQWTQRTADALKVSRADIENEAAKTDAILQAESSQLGRLLHDAIVDAIVEPIPYVTLPFCRLLVKLVATKCTCS
jgi:hypothetical protein